MALYDQFTWAPGEGLKSVTDFGLGQAQQTGLYANAEETKVDTAKKTAELQEFMSDTAKNLRETEREASLGKFKDDIANNEALQNYYKNNPNFRDERAAAKAHADMLKTQKEITDDEHTIERGEVATYYDPKTNTIDLDNYGKSRARLIQMGVHTEDDTPTVEELQNDPKAMDLAKRAATYTYLTQEQKVAQMAAEEKAKAEQKQQDSVNAAAMARTREEIKSKEKEGNLDRTSRKDIENIRATARTASDKVKLEGVKYKADVARNGGKPLSLLQAGGSIKDLTTVGMTLILDDPLAENLPDDTKMAAVALAASNSQQQFMADPRNAPSWYMRRNLEDYLADDRAHEEGSTFIGIPYGGNLDLSKVNEPGANKGGGTPPPAAKKEPIPAHLSAIWEQLSDTQKQQASDKYDTTGLK